MAGTISERMKSAVEARLEEVYEELGYRPRMSKCSDEGGYSDISSDDSEADLMKESQRSFNSTARTTDRSTFTGSFVHDGRESFLSTASCSDAPDKRRFGRISDTLSSAESARSTWNNLFSSTEVRDTDDDISHFSFPDCDDYMDLFEDEPAQASTGPEVVAGSTAWEDDMEMEQWAGEQDLGPASSTAELKFPQRGKFHMPGKFPPPTPKQAGGHSMGAGSIMKSRQSDGSLPDNPTREHGEHGRGSSSLVHRGGPSSSGGRTWTDPALQPMSARQPLRRGPSSSDGVQRGGPSSSWEGLWTDPVLEGTQDRQPRGGTPSFSDARRTDSTPQGMPPSAAWTSPGSTFTLPPLRTSPCSRRTSPCSTGTPPPSSPQAAEEAGGAVSDASFGARSDIGWLLTSLATPRAMGSDCASATGAPLGEVVSSASWRAATPSAGMGMPRSLPPLPPAESSAKSGAYIRRRRPS